MYNFPIGVIVDSFRTDTKTSILKAAALGADGIQMYCTKGENAPENLTPEKRRELLDFVKSNGLRFSAYRRCHSVEPSPKGDYEQQ